MAKVVSFGEVMLRLTCPGYTRIIQTDSFDISYAGSEANVSVSLALFGHESAFVTKFPENDVGQAAINELRRYGVDTARIVRGGPRLGVYYIEKGASQRGGKVIYDRAGSSIALAKAEEFDWDGIFQGADWFHFSGITPALGGELPEACLSAVKAAKKRGMTVSCDLNYRAKLWSKEEAGRVMNSLMPYVDVCIANDAEVRAMFGILPEDASDERAASISIARQMAERFGCKTVAVTLLNEYSSSGNTWSGMLYQDGEAYFARTYDVHVVDRVGCGDSFGAGIINALLRGWDCRKAIEFGVAAGAMKMTIEYDFCLAGEDEILAVMSSEGAALVR